MKEGDIVTVQFQLGSMEIEISRGGEQMRRVFDVPADRQFKQRRIAFNMYAKNDSILIH